MYPSYSIIVVIVAFCLKNSAVYDPTLPNPWMITVLFLDKPLFNPKFPDNGFSILLVMVVYTLSRCYLFLMYSFGNKNIRLRLSKLKITNIEQPFLDLASKNLRFRNFRNLRNCDHLANRIVLFCDCDGHSIIELRCLRNCDFIAIAIRKFAIIAIFAIHFTTLAGTA